MAVGSDVRGPGALLRVLESGTSSYNVFLQEYKLLFEGAGSNPGDKTLEDRFFEHEVSEP